MILLPDVLNTRQFTWVWVVKINAIWIGRAKVCTLEEDDVFIISTCGIKYHSMVMYISSAVNYFRSMCKSNDSLCIVIYILYKQLDYYIPKDSCVYQEKCVAFQKCSWHQPPSLSLCRQSFFSQPGHLTIQRWDKFWKPFTHSAHFLADKNSSLYRIGQ